MWRTVKLGDVCAIKTGKKDVNEGNSVGKFPFFTCAKEHTYSDVYSFDCEAILIAGNGAVGQTTYFKGKFEAYQRTYVLTDFQLIHPKLLLFILQGTLMQHLSSKVLGNTIPYIKKGMLENFEIPLPPLAEQQRIVEKLDKSFAEIDKAIDLVNKSVEQSEKFADEVVRSNFLNNGKTRKKIFSDVCTLQRGFDLPTRLRKPGAYPLYSANGVTDYIDDYKVTAPAVVTGRSGTIGAVHFSDKNIWALNTALYVKDFKGNFPKYIYYFLKSFNLKKYASGAGVPTLNRNVLAEEGVFLEDDFEKQIAISSRLDNILDICTHLISKQQAKVQCYVELKSAILKQALQPPQQ